MDQLPLRIPPDLIDHVEEHKRSQIRTRRMADKDLFIEYDLKKSFKMCFKKKIFCKKRQKFSIFIFYIVGAPILDSKI